MLSSQSSGMINPIDDGQARVINPESDDRKLLIVDDEGPFRRSLSRALERRHFCVLTAETLEQASMIADSHRPAFAVIDLRLGNRSGLDLVHILRRLRTDVRMIMVTGYGNIASAVTAIQAGAVNYLAKPVDADDVVAALLDTRQCLPAPRRNPMSAQRIRWEYIQRVFEQCDRNMSETARRLGMHRRTLQRILSKRAPQE